MGTKPMVDTWLFEHQSEEIHIDGYRAGRIFQFRENVYGILTKAPHAGGDTWSYLIIGPEKAMVIDTGFGIGDLRAVLDRFAEGKEYIVVNTHFHGDHSLGNYQYEEVWISQLDAFILKSHMYPEYWSEFCLEIVDHDFYEEEDVICFKEYKIRGFENHTVFDLGEGYKLEAILLSGHSPGETAFLDKQNRILFSGDAVMEPFPTTLSSPFSEQYPNHQFATVTAFYKGLQDLSKRLPEFDVLMDGHGVPESSKEKITDLLKCAREIIRKPDEDYLVIKTRKGEGKSKCVGTAVINYIDARV
ncbi:MAG: MBL fold metallo-hydrolase [Clostridiaceae bacterium]|nr:MBL fold metallo-hydrolase [Clostridiaceae bacterium]